MALPATIIKYLSQKQYTEAEAEQAWAEYIARALPFEVRYRVWLKSQFRRQHQEVDVQLRFYEDRALRGIITKINADEVIFNADKWRVIFSEFGQLMLPQIIETQGQAEMTAIIDLRFDLLNPGVQSFIRGRNFKFSFDTNQTTIDQLRSQLDEGLRLGEGIPKLKKRVKHVFDIAENYRAERIARTEVIKASNFAHEAGYIQSGVVEAKIWHTAVDERRCPFCAELHNKELSLGTNWFNQGDVMEVGDAKLKLDYEDVGYPPLHPNCYAADTELLTRDGWKYISEINIDDTLLTIEPHTMVTEWQPINSIIISKHNSYMYHLFKGKKVDMLVTPGHPMFAYIKLTSKKYNGEYEPVTMSIEHMVSGFYLLYCKDYGANNEYIDIADLEIKTESYNGVVYDVEIAKNHTILTRRNGCVVWGSNCRCRIIPKLMPIEGSL